MKDKLKMILFVLVFGSILTTALVAVNFYTTPLIEKNEAITLKSSVLNALAIPFDKENVEEIESKFDSSINQETVEGKFYYSSNDGTFAFPFEGPGLWGPITGIMAMGDDMESIQRITIIRQEETPGLGSRIAEQDYLDTFQNKRFDPELVLTGEGKADEANEIDAITGATLSSDAFVNILNDQYEMYMTLMGRE